MPRTLKNFKCVYLVHYDIKVIIILMFICLKTKVQRLTSPK